MYVDMSFWWGEDGRFRDKITLQYYVLCFDFHGLEAESLKGLPLANCVEFVLRHNACCSLLIQRESATVGQTCVFCLAGVCTVYCKGHICAACHCVTCLTIRWHVFLYVCDMSAWNKVAKSLRKPLSECVCVCVCLSLSLSLSLSLPLSLSLSLPLMYVCCDLTNTTHITHRMEKWEREANKTSLKIVTSILLTHEKLHFEQPEHHSAAHQLSWTGPPVFPAVAWATTADCTHVVHWVQRARSKS